MSIGIEGLDEVMSVRAAFITAEKALAHGPANFYFEKVERYVRILFDRFAPFKPGDRVRMTVDPQINTTNSWGFMKGKHFLIVGALGTVESVDVSERGIFRAGVIWDDDSRVDAEGVVTPIARNNRKQWWFSEQHIARVWPV